MMKTKVSSKSNGQLIFLAIVAVFTIIQGASIETSNDIVLVIILSVICLVFSYNFLKVRTVSYDSEYVYLKKFSKEFQLPYADIVKIKRVLGRFYEGSNMNFGYTLVYFDENGKRRTCHFYIPLSNVVIWNRFKEKIIQNNPSVELSE